MPACMLLLDGLWPIYLGHDLKKRLIKFRENRIDNFTPKVVVGAIVNQEAWQPSETIQSSTSELETFSLSGQVILQCLTR